MPALCRYLRGDAMGKAVIVSRTASPSDFIVEGETGYLRHSGNVGELREKMEELIANPELAARWVTLRAIGSRSSSA